MSSTENLAIMITDIAGFTARTSAQSRAEMHRMLDQHNDLMKRTLEMYAGHWVKSTGDGMIASFRSPTNAVQCGMAIQDAFAEYNYDRPENQQIHVRVAINLGEVRWEGTTDLFGEAVNVAARIESLTPVGEVYFTQAVYLPMNKAEVPSEAVGVETVRGVPEPIQIYRVPAGEVTRLVASGEPIEALGLQYPFGGMPHPRIGDTPAARPAAKNKSKTSDVKPEKKPSGGRWKKVLWILLAIFIFLVIAGEADKNKQANLPAEPDATQSTQEPITQSGSTSTPTPAKLVRLTVQTEPADATVRILNIKPVYQAGIQLEQGNYHLEVSREGYQTDRRWVALDKDTEMQVALSPQITDVPPATRDAPAKLPGDPGNATVDVQRRNDLLLVISKVLDGPGYYLERHPESPWAMVFQLQNNKSWKMTRALRAEARNENAEAQLGLAYMHATGQGVMKSTREAKKWIEKALQSDRGLALWFRSVAALSEDKADMPAREQALNGLREAARLNEPLAHAMLGILHQDGEQVPRNDKQARSHFERAARAGLGFAEAALAGLYIEGRGGKRQVDAAIALLQRSAGKQDPTGQFYLGFLYEGGVGVPKNPDLARRLYEASAKAGYRPAKEAVQRLPR